MTDPATAALDAYDTLKDFKPGDLVRVANDNDDPLSGKTVIIAYRNRHNFYYVQPNVHARHYTLMHVSQLELVLQFL